MASQAITFDAPLKQPTSVPIAPAGVTFDQPLSSSMTLPSQGATQPSAPSTQQLTSQPQPSKPTASMYATPGSMPGDPLAAKAQLWAQNVQNDLMHGTDLTGVGRVLKALGAHGLESGNSEGVAKFMGSLPLGLARAMQGEAELTQKGERWQGVKNTAGGLLDAATIPSSFVAPESAEVSAAGLDKAGTAIAEQASKAVKAAKGPFSLKTIQPELQQGIRSVLDTVSREEGVAPGQATSIRDAAIQLAAAVRSKASSLYKQLDAATGGGRFQRFDEQLQNIQRAIRDVTGIDPDREGELIERLNTVQDAKDAALADAKAAGVDPKLIDQANATWKRAAALDDLSRHLRMSTSGMRPELVQAGAKSNPEVLSTTRLFPRINSMYNSARLQSALGEDNAQKLLQSVDAAHLRMLKIQANQKALKTAAKVGAYSAGLGYGGYEVGHHFLGGQ